MRITQKRENFDIFVIITSKGKIFMQNEKITQIVKDAFELEKNEQYKSAIELLYQGLNIEPDNNTILGQIAFLYFKLKNYDIAKEYAQKALLNDNNLNFAKDVLIKIYIETQDIEEFVNTINDIDTNKISQELLNTIFQGYLKFNLYKDAIDICNRTENKESFNDTTLYYFALCNYFIKDYVQAEKYAELAKEKNADNIDNLILLANIAYKDNRFDKVEELINSISEDKIPAHAYYLMGRINLDKQQYQKAIDYFTQALTLNPKNKDCLYSLANAYYFMGWLDEAQKTISKAKVLAPEDIDILFLNAEIYFWQNKYEYALNIISTILELNPEYINAKLLKVNIYLKKELFELARCELINILSKDAENIDALKLYYQACQNLGFKEQVLTTLEKILLIEPENTDYMCKLAGSFCDLKRWEDAKIVLNKVFEITKEYENAYELAITVYFNLGDFNKAEDIAQKWLNVNPNSHYANYVLAQINMPHNLQTALEYVKTALTLNPSEKKYYLLAGQIYETMSDLHNAIQYYNEAFEISTDRKLAIKLMALSTQTQDMTFIERMFNKIKKTAPFDLDITFAYADFLSASDEKKKATKVLNSLQKGIHDKDLKAIVKTKVKELK